MHVNVVGRSLDIAAASDQIQAVMQRLMDYRQNVEKYYKHWYQSAVELRESIKVAPSMPRRIRRKVDVPDETCENYFMRTVAIPMLG